MGDADTGKTHMASTLCMLAGERRMEARFFTASSLVVRPPFQVFADAYERQSAVITTNLEFSRWDALFGDNQMAAAVIDRIVHHGRLVQFRGESCRMRNALMQEG